MPHKPHDSPSKEDLGQMASCQTGASDPWARIVPHTIGNFSIMSQPHSAMQRSQNLRRTLHGVLSPNITNITTRPKDRLCYYQMAEDLWRAAIVVDKEFTTLKATNKIMMVLNQRWHYDQRETGIRLSAGVMDGKRKRTTDDIGNGNRVNSPTVSRLDISSNHEPELEPTTSGEHFDTALISMYGLASVISMRRQYLDAEQCRWFTLEWPEKLITSESLSILTGMHDLAKILIAQDKDEEAEELLRLTVELMEEARELDDPEVMRTTSSLAFVLTKRGKHDEAEAMYRKTLKMQNKVLMWNDPETEETLGHLGVLLKNNGKLKEAAQLTARYRLPAMVKAIMLSTFPRRQLGLHVGLIDDHHDDNDVRAFLEDDSHIVGGIEVCLEDDSVAVELLLDPEDLRIVVIVSQCALMDRRQRLENAIKDSLQYGMGDWRDLGIDSFVCCIDQDEKGNIWALPHHLDL